MRTFLKSLFPVLWLLAAALVPTLGCTALEISVINPSLDPRTDARRHGKSHVDASEGIPIVHLYGTPYERGLAHGALLKEEIGDLLDQYVGISIAFTGGAAKYETYARRMLPQIPAEYQEELRGLAEGAGQPFDRVLVANVFLDVCQVVACSTFALDSTHTEEGLGPLLARNLDFPSLNIVGRYSHLFVHHFDDGRSMALPTWPGLIGVLSGMNDRGLALAMTQVRSSAFCPDGIPYAIVYRMVLERCGSSSEARAELARLVKRATVTTNLIAQDRAGDSFVAEVEPREDGQGVAVLREASNGKVCCTNHFIEDHGALTPQARTNSLHRCKLIELQFRNDGRLTVEDAKSLLSDVATASDNLQSMIFLPERNRLVMSANGPKAVELPFYTYDLAALFKDAGR